MPKVCPNCGAEILDFDGVCDYAGADFHKDSSFRFFNELLAEEK